MKSLTPLLILPLFAIATTAYPQTDIEYGVADGVSLKLDAVIPEGDGPFPAAILVHGGGWVTGDKNGGRNGKSFMGISSSCEIARRWCEK